MLVLHGENAVVSASSSVCPGGVRRGEEGEGQGHWHCHRYRLGYHILMVSLTKIMLNILSYFPIVLSLKITCIYKYVFKQLDLSILP